MHVIALNRNRESCAITMRQCNSEIESLALEAAAERHSGDKEGSRWFWVSSDNQPTHAMSSIIDLDADMGFSEECNSDRTPSVLTVTVWVSRLHNYYVYNIMVPMTVITCIGVSTVTVPICQVSRRLSVNLTLLLTSVAYKFIVSQDLPNVAYLTFLDKYVLFCLGTLVLYILENVIVSIFAMRVCKREGRDGTVDALDIFLSENTTNEELKDLERWIDYFSFGFTCAITIAFCVTVCFLIRFAQKTRTRTRDTFLTKLEEPFLCYTRHVETVCSQLF